MTEETHEKVAQEATTDQAPGKEKEAKAKRLPKPKLSASDKLVNLMTENPGSYVQKNDHQKSTFVFASNGKSLGRFQKKAFDDVASKFTESEKNTEKGYTRYQLK